MSPLTSQAVRRSKRLKQREELLVEQSRAEDNQITNKAIDSASWASVADWVQQTTTTREQSRQLSTYQSAFSPMMKGHTLPRGTKRPRMIDDEHTLSRSLASKSSNSWGAEREVEMKSHGIFMSELPAESLNSGSQQLLRSILDARFATPPWFLDTVQFRGMLDLIRTRNEASMVRHLTPLLVPSPEMLRITGYWAHDYAIAESMGSLWSRCTTLLRPSPKPDIVLGISHTAFTHDELYQLHRTNNLLTTECGQVHYPFLICEAKGNVSIEDSERQAMHAASTTVNAVLHLCRHADIYNELNGQVLAFSMSHNHSVANLFGHFARFDRDSNITFHRCLLHCIHLSQVFTGNAWTRPHEIMLAICEHFFPPYLERIRRAIATLADVPTIKIQTNDDSLDDALVESTTTAELLQERDELKRQAAQRDAELLQECNELKRQLAQRDDSTMTAELLQERDELKRQLAQRNEQILHKDQQISQMIQYVVQ